jgi:two-component system NtrC family sensor kinase
MTTTPTRTRQPSELELSENMWVEMIRTMEELYGNLARAQTEMERRAEELKSANEFIQDVLRSMINALVVADAEGRISLANESCLALLGRSTDDLVGRPLAALFVPGSENELYPGTALWRHLLTVGAVRNVESQFAAPNGMPVPVSINASLFRERSGDAAGIVLVATDLREIKRLLETARAEAAALDHAYRELKALQARLIQSEKMSSLGRMAASVAHEINNPLGGILVYAHLLLEDRPQDSPDLGMLQKIVRETTRCKEIVRGLLGFARMQQGQHRVLDLGSVVHTTVEAVAVQPIFRGIDRKVEVPAGPLPVEGNEGTLQQALTNLLVNAAEALGGRGHIEIRAWAEPEASMARVAVRDDGPGIPPKLLDQIFEPFFTTKDPGQGTGLGLAIAYAAARQHGGTIDVRSEPGHGTTFTINLPLAAMPGASR